MAELNGSGGSRRSSICDCQRDNERIPICSCRHTAEFIGITQGPKKRIRAVVASGSSILKRGLNDAGRIRERARRGRAARCGVVALLVAVWSRPKAAVAATELRVAPDGSSSLK